MSNTYAPLMPVNKIYIALDKANLDWEVTEVEEFDHMWKRGIPVDLIAKNFGREEEEVGALIIDRAMKGFINPRRRGVFGG